MKRTPTMRTAAALLLAAVFPLAYRAEAQVADRIAAAPSSGSLVTVEHSVHGLARASYDQGAAQTNATVQNLSLSFTMSAAQKSNLQTLLTAQQTPGSALYHQWLSPAQFAAQFGASAHDISVAEQWLTSQGFTVDGVKPNGLGIHFHGTVGQLNAAFHTEMHRYSAPGQEAGRLANSTALQLPSAFSGVIDGVENLAQFRMHPLHTMHSNYTATVNGTVEHALTPADIATIYGIGPLYSAGYTGAGQTIAIVGQTQIETVDINNFRAAAGLGAANLTQTLLQNTGPTQDFGGGDEAESDLDLEWSGAIAQAANLQFIYTGAATDANGNLIYGVNNSLAYAVESRVAPIISMSYGECELYLAPSDITQIEALLAEASSQGQTVFLAAGDAGATDCDDGTTNTTTTQGLSVDYPGSSAFVTAVGGTEFNEGSGSYWNSTNGSTGGSAMGYIPEMVWNEGAQSLPAGNGPLGGGGGASAIFGKPSWQVAAGVPNDGARDTPDISLDAASIHDPYIYCSPAPIGNTTQDACTGGFAQAIAVNNLAGGTSFAAPIMAGIMTLVNQKVAAASGVTGTNYLGNINPILYSLFGSSPAAFNDITVGNNAQACLVGTLDCTTGSDGYSAAAGYDQASGLGSINANALAQAFPATTTQIAPGGTLVATTTGLTVNNPNPVSPLPAGTTLTFWATLNSSVASTTAPSGTMTLTVDGTQVSSQAVTAFSTASITSPTTIAGTASYALVYSPSSLAPGAHTLVATYSGNGTYAGSSSTLKINVINANSQGAFTLSAGNITVPANATSGSSVLTITPQNGYSGTLTFALTVPNGFQGCYDLSNVGVLPSGTTTTKITIITSTTQCNSSAAHHAFVHTPASAANKPVKTGGSRVPLEAVAGTLLCVGLLGRKRKHWPLTAVLCLLTLGTAVGLSGCGGGSNGTIPVNPGSGSGSGSGSGNGTYTLSVTGEDTRYTNLTATTNFTLTIQ